MTAYFYENPRLIFMMVGLLMSFLFILFGILIVHFQHYNLIAGYNRAPESVKSQYDIDGLAAHIGNGLITLGVLLIISLVFLHFDMNIWFASFLGLFTFIVVIILIGARKFMPARQAFAVNSPVDAKHPFLHWLLPVGAYKAVEQGTRQWLQECKHCGHKQDYWEAGGERFKAAGEPVVTQWCDKCQRLRLHKVRKKIPQEISEL